MVDGQKREHLTLQLPGSEQDRQLFDDLIETLEIGSLCALGGGIPLPLKNALNYFQGELREYFES